MKKLTFLLLLTSFCLINFAQNNTFNMTNGQLNDKQVSRKNSEAVTIIDIDTVPNVYSFAGNKLSLLWVDPILDVITLVTTSPPTLNYHISRNGGTDWEHNISLIDPGQLDDSILYINNTNHSIFNPEGNTDPDNAYLTHISGAAIEVDRSGSAYIHGVGSIGDTSSRTMSVLPVDNHHIPYNPSGYDLTSAGEVFLVNANVDWLSGTIDYMDSLIITKGTWDDELNDFSYVSEKLEALIDHSDGLETPVDYKVAFGPDGQTGYILMLGDNGGAEQIEGFENFYPIYWKSTDAGTTWEGPEVIQMDGPDGLMDLVNYHLTDEQIEELFVPPVPSRDEISYTTAYNCDIIVDKNDNLHIAVVIGPTGSSPYSIITAENYIATFNIITDDGGETWHCRKLGNLRTFRGTYGDLTDDNRIQITTNQPRDRIFTSWLDTDLEEEEDNNRPDIWCRGNDVERDCRTWNPYGEDAPTNVTELSEAMWQAYFFLAPKYSFLFEPGEYTIPFIYLEVDPTDPAAEAIIKYIKDFKFTDADFEPCLEGVTDNSILSKRFMVIGNYPNPLDNKTTIRVDLFKTSNVNVSITSITGQQIFEKAFGKLSQGQHDLKIKLNDFNPGVYFYTVNAGNDRMTNKMVVQ